MIIKPIGTILLPNWITVSGYTFGTIDHPSLVKLTDTAITVTGNINLTGYADLSDIADPGFPAANKSRLFSNSGHAISISPSDVWHDLSMGGLGTSSCIHDPITITDQGGLNITWSAGIIFDAFISGGNQLVTIAAQPANQACTASSVNYLFYDRSAGVLVLNTTGPDYSDGDFSIAHILTTHNDIIQIIYRPIDREVVHNIKWSLREAFPSVVVNGLIVSEHAGVNAFDVDQTAGSFMWGGFALKTGSPIDSTVTPIVRWFHNAADNWETDTNSQIDAANWDDVDDGVGVIGTNAGKYYRSVFVTCGDYIHWVYGQIEYANVNAALVAPNPTLPPVLEKLPNTTALIMKHGDAAFPAAGSNQWIDVRPMLTGGAATTLISDHGNLAGLGDDDHSQYLLTDGTRKVEGTLFLKERAAAIAHVATYGQIWVKTAVPCELWFTDDIGTNFQIGGVMGSIIMADGGTIGQAAGPLLTFGDTLNELWITGCNVGIGTTIPTSKIHVVRTGTGANSEKAMFLSTESDYYTGFRFENTHADADGNAIGWSFLKVTRKTDGYGGIPASALAIRQHLSASDIYRFIILDDGKVGIGGIPGTPYIPGTLLQLSGAEAYLTLQNTTAENIEGGAETRIIFEDHANIALAQIQGSHDGTADDTKGDLIFFTHTGTALTEALRLSSAQLATFAGNIAAANYTAANLLTACATSAGGLDFSGAYTLTVAETASTTSYHTDVRAATWLAANHETTYTHTDIALNTTHRSSDGSDHTFVDQAVTIASTPAFGGIVVANNGTIGQAAGPLLTFDDNNNYLEISGCNVGIGTVIPYSKLEVFANLNAPDDLGDFDNYQVVIRGGDLTGQSAGILLSSSGNTYGGSAIVHFDTGGAGLGDLVFYTKRAATAVPPVEIMRLHDDGGISMPDLKSGTDQADAGAAAGELYSDTNDDNTVKMGV